MREICLDIETTGLDPKSGHRIIEIACIELINKSKTGKSFHTYVNPRRDVPQEAVNIHGITYEFLQDKPIFDHVAEAMIAFIQDSTLVIHNAAFDTKFINHELRMIGRDILNMSKVVDSLLIARNKFPGGKNSLDALCNRFNIDLSRRTKHGALLDTELLADVYLELMGGAQTNLFISQNSLQNSESLTQLDDATLQRKNKKTTLKRDFTASDEDLEKHEKFIKENFKKNFWYN